MLMKGAAKIVGFIVFVVFGGHILIAIFPPDTPFWVVLIAAFGLSALANGIFIAAKRAIFPSPRPRQDDFTSGVQAMLDKLEEIDPEARRKVGQITVVHQEEGDG
jgi:hypothetical protein